MKTNEKIESNKTWQLAKKIMQQVRKTVERVPYEEHYSFGTMPMQYSTQLITSVAMAVGKGKEAGYDWRYGRGQLFALRGLLIAGEEQGSLKTDTALMSSLDSLQAVLEAEIAKAEADRAMEGKQKSKGK